MTRLLDAVSLGDVQRAFVSAHASQEERRNEVRQQEQDREARRARPMTNSLPGLKDQIAAALAATRHAQDKAMSERRRENELNTVRNEARAKRSASTRKVL